MIIKKLTYVLLILALVMIMLEITWHPLGAREIIGIWPVPSGTPWTYQLWSGFVPALTVTTVLSAVASLYRIHNCHKQRCWRLGRHKINGTPWCNKHHDNARPEMTDSDRLNALISIMEALLQEVRSGREKPSGNGSREGWPEAQLARAAQRPARPPQESNHNDPLGGGA